MRLFLRSVLAVSLLLSAAGCAGTSAPRNASSYRVTWSVRRASDNASLASVVSPPVRVGAGETRVRTDRREPSENRPAFPELRARLEPIRRDRRPYELVTRVLVREAVPGRPHNAPVDYEYGREIPELAERLVIRNCSTPRTPLSAFPD